MIKTSEYFPVDGQTQHEIAVANLLYARDAIGALLQCGIRDFVVSPGSRNTPVLVGLERCMAAYAGTSWAFEVHRVLDERAAAFLAVGITRASAKPTALLCTSGSAAANYFPAIIEANYSDLPLVVLTADRPPELLNCGAPQTIDQMNLFGNHGRGFLNLGAPQADGDSSGVSSQINHFLVEQWGAFPGPVQINLPFRKPLWTSEAEEVVFETPSFPAAPQVLHSCPELPEEKVTRLANYFEDIDKGCIVIGPRCHFQDSLDIEFGMQVAQLGAALGWPVIAEPASGVRFQGEYQSVISMADGIFRSNGWIEKLAPEFILRFGKFPTSKFVGNWLVQHCDVETLYVSSSASVQDPLRNIETSLVASPSQFCEGIVRNLGAHAGSSPWMAKWEEAELVVHNLIMQACPLQDTPLWEGAVSHHLANRLPNESALHLASSMPIRDMDSFAPTRPGNVRVFSSRGANGIDGTIATALGEAIALPTNATTLLIGDLATLHDLGGLHLAAVYEREGDLSSPFVIVIVDNNGGGIFEHLPISTNTRLFEKAFITPQNTDLHRLITGLGLKCETVATHSQLNGALENAYSTNGVSVVVAEVERGQSTQKRRQLWGEVKAQLESSSFGEEES